MAKHDEKQKKQDLGIFYTPPEVVGFVFDILNIWKDKETGRWEARKHFPSVIDPAVGDGVFLKAAIESGFTKPDWIFGLDIDGDVVKKWKGVNLLKEFGGKEDDLEAHFFHQNGLDRIHWEQHINKYKYKLKKKDTDEQQFNLVVGNPPYGGLGVYEEMKMLSESVLSAKKVQRIYTQKLDTLFGEQEERVSKVTTTEHVKLSLSQVKIFELKELSRNLINLEIWKDKKYLPQRINHNLNINGVEINLKDILTLKEIEKLKSYPIEILFIERFIQLAKPGGWISVIIPDGILSNSNAHYVRDFIAAKTKVEAIVSLPRETFKQAGTSAKTSILFLKKLPDKEKPSLDYPVFMASLANISKENFQTVAKSYQKFYNSSINTMTNSKFVQITKDQNGREAIMVRVDKTVKEMMLAKPKSRWDSKYWHPKYDELISILGDSGFPLEDVGKFIELITYGSTKPRDYALEAGKGVRYIRSVNVLFTGLNEANIHWVEEGGRLDGEQYRVRINDVVMNKCGTGTAGRSFCFLKKDKIVVSQHTMLIRLKEIEPCYFVVYMDTVFGAGQFEKYDKGTSGQTHIDFEDIKTVKIPLLPEKVRNHIESEYKKMSAYHDKAMEGKRTGDDGAYKENIETAEKMLKVLIARTEAVIRGERRDVI